MTGDPQIGQTLGAHRITRLLKRTGMSMVYLARDDKLERDVVVKVMLPSHNDDEAFSARFQQEALATARLSHPNIIHIYDFGHQDDLFYMVMEYLPGGSLYDRLEHAGATGRRIDMAQALHIAGLMAQALDYAHRAGFVHRDVKPSNILFSSEGHPVLTDLGIVKTREGPQLTESLVSVGTPEYMSPEQGRGDPVDARSDVYSLGVVLYELLAGMLPFQAESTWGLIYKHLHEAPPPLHTFNRAVSPALCSVVEKALAKWPEDRFQTARELAIALERAQAAPRRRLYPPPPLPPPLGVGEDVPHLAAGDKVHHTSRSKRRPVQDRTDRLPIPGRGVTGAGTASPSRFGSRATRLPGIAVALLVGMVLLTAIGMTAWDWYRRAAPPVMGAGGAGQAPVTAALAGQPTATLTPRATQSAAERPAAVRSAAPVVVLTALPGVTSPSDMPDPTSVSMRDFPAVMLAGAGEDQVALVAYLDPEGGYGLYVPESWSRISDSLGVSFEAPDRMARILVHEVVATTPDEPGAAIARRYVEGAQAIFQEVREVEGAASPARELPAYHQQLEAKVLSIPVKARLLAVNTGITGVVVVAAASATSEPTYRPVFAAVLDSFRVAGVPVPRPMSPVTPAAPSRVHAAAPVAQAPTVAAPVTPLPTVAMPRFTVDNASINVRAGPGTAYPVIGALRQGESHEIIGRNPGGDWWQFAWRAQRGWVSKDLVTANGPAGRVAVITTSPPVAAGSSPTATPTVGAIVLPSTAVPGVGLPAPEIRQPTCGRPFDPGGQAVVHFDWDWNGPPLTDNQGFEVRLWREDQSEHYGATGPVPETFHYFYSGRGRDSKQISGGFTDVNVWETYAAQEGGPGRYYWTVAVVQISPYSRIGPEATPCPLQLSLKP